MKGTAHLIPRVRGLDSPEDLAQVIALQRVVWPGAEQELVPSHLLLTAAHNGGLIAGAFIEERLAGFVFSFLGFQQAGQARRLKHCSHMLGVHPDFRGAGVGAALKLYQRDFVLGQGLDLITWTYDPLLARNAQLNIAKLGAVCHTYLTNLYGDLEDALNTGLPTDRFQVDWWIGSEPVAARVNGKRASRPGFAELLACGASLLNPASPHGEPQPPEIDPEKLPGRPIVLIEIPGDFLALKAADPTLALCWRTTTRRAFQTLFDSGFTVTDFLWQASPEPRAAYVLTKDLPHAD